MRKNSSLIKKFGICIWVILLIILTLPVVMKAISYGSDSAVSRQASVMFPASENATNTMLGFAVFQNGFRLENINTICNFNDFEPISGNIRLNAGVLYLNQDATFIEGADFKTSGTIDGQFHAMIFKTSNKTSFTIGENIISNFSALPSCSSLGYTIQALDWSYDGKYVAVAASNGYVYIFQYDQSTGPNCTPVASLSVGTIYDLEWHPNQYYLAIGSNTAPRIRVYYFDPTAIPPSLTQVASATPANQVNTVTWHPAGNFLLACYLNRTIATYKFVMPGGLSAPVTFTFAAGSFSGTYHTASWNGDGSYFVVGVGTRIELFLFTDSGTSFSMTRLDEQNVSGTVQTISWSWIDDRIALGTNLAANYVQLWQRNSSNVLQFIRNATTQPSATVNTVSWSPEGDNLLAGTNVSGASNQLYLYNWDETTLMSQTGTYAGNVMRSSWRNDNCTVSVGGSFSTLLFYYICLTGPNPITFRNSELFFNSDLNILVPVHFAGKNILNLDGNTITFGQYGQIILDAQSSLIIQNAVISNIVNSNFQIADNLCSLGLSYVKWQQSSDVTWNKGQLDIFADVLITGSKTLSYTSTATTTIYAPASLIFDSNTTFSYNPSNASKTLIQFDSQAASLHLYESLLYAPTGLRLTKGTLTLEGLCQLKANTIDINQGIWIGDGTSINDVRLRILAESGLYASSGYVVYKNVS